MPFDAVAMAAIADEIGARTGSQVQRIIQPSAGAVGLFLYGGGEQGWLLLSTDARYSRVAFIDGKLAKAFATPSSFIMLLRKYLESSRLRSVAQVPEERVLRLTFGRDEEPVHLVAETMGKHSNIVLLNAADEILGAVKIVPRHQSRVRPILPGHPYQPPPARERDPELFPAGPRPDPLTAAGAMRLLLEKAPLTAPLRAALLGLLPAASPFLVNQILQRSNQPVDVTVNEADLDRVQAACIQLYSLFGTRQWEPTVFGGRAGRYDFAPYRPLGVEELRPAASMSEAIEACLGGNESRDAYTSLRKDLAEAIERARRSAARRIDAMRKGLEATKGTEDIKERGQLVLAYQWALKPRAATLDIPDLDMSIPVDPTLSASDNAERLFRRYRKLRDARRRLPALLSEAEAEQAHFEDLAVFAGLADSEGALRDLLREVQIPAAGPLSTNTKKPAKRGPLRFQQGPYTLLAGRSARENDEVTFGRANRQDLWLHARGRTGAHVILQTSGPAPDEAVEYAAASVAAYFSEGRHDTRVDVILTLVRDVRKVSGGPPGRVTFRNERTVTVAPSLEGWEPAGRQ
ncbi:MAG: Rqc2 family fibronectin-binding protein [Chloroflexota bacterium]